ncbi:MAG: glycosyltransferase [Gammaproteobacteria bacterium]|nr:glycosyltransferase [Gammaproteobacteria bacterium]
MQVFVLGMHRSGTSALARVLNLMGCYFGSEAIAIEANKENPKGFWERRDVRQVNDAILRNAGCDWDRISDFAIDRIDAGQRALYRDVIADIVLGLDAHRPWFVKEPRCCLTFELWRECLELPVCVYVFRDPVDVAKSLERRNGMPAQVGLALWEAYTVTSLNASAGVTRVFVSYEALMSAPDLVVGRMMRLFGEMGYALREPEDAELSAFLDGGLRHFASDGEERKLMSAKQTALFDTLRGAEEGGGKRPRRYVVSPASVRRLKGYEETSPNLVRRAAEANAALIRGQRVDASTELALKRLEVKHALEALDRTMAEARRWRDELDGVKVRNAALLAEASANRRELAALAGEANGLRGKVDRLAREVGATEKALRHKDLELLAATETLRDSDRELEDARTKNRALIASADVKDRDLVLAADALRKTEAEVLELRRTDEGLRQSLRTKDRELDDALRTREQESLEAQLVAKGLRQSLRTKDRELDDALRTREQESLEAQLVAKGLRQSLSNKDRDLTLATEEIGTLRGERSRLESAARADRTRIAELRALMDQTIGQVELLLQSRRWRFGHAALSLPHQLIGRPRPRTVADHLRELREDTRVQPRDAQQQHTRLAAAPSERGSSAAPAKVKARRQITVLVLSWDVGHNPLGRAYLLAEALARSYTVVLAGFQFPRFGDRLWKPLRHAPFHTVTIPGGPFPDFQRTLEKLTRRVDADVVVACKARLPAVQAGLMLKALRNRPLLIDVDDYELSFFANRDPLTDLASVDPGALAEPFEEAWTRYTENLLGWADGLLVSNEELKRRFGGVVVPHARDERVFNPDRFDREASRRALGLAADLRVVLFVGTPRPHKGVGEILDAVNLLKRDDVRLVVVGTPPDKAFGDALKARGGDALVMLPDTPFDQLASVTAAADLVCLLQDSTTEIARYQLPAKVVDAVSMGIPVLATDVPPLAELIQSGAVEPVTTQTLAERIGAWLDATPESRAAQAKRARGAFLRNYSYEAIHRTLFGEIERCLAAPEALPEDANGFLGEQARRYAPAETDGRDGWDFVMFWKQGDVGLYGRRFDMLVRELARRDEIRRIAVFDAPFSVYHVLRDHVRDATVHHQEVAENKLVRRWGLLDQDKVTHHVFLFDERRALAPDRYPPRANFADFVDAELDAVGIDPANAVFWYYPVLEEFDALRRRFRPRATVVDVVDDQRAWPDRSEEDRAEMTRHYRAVVEDADVVLANCETVREAMSAFGREVALVPNGCDTEPAPDEPESPAFLRFRDLPRPVLGLVGNLEGKTDLPLLERLARERPAYQIVLIGSTHTNLDMLRLDERPNVHFFGVVKYPEVKAWVRHFDVALLPHLDTEQTRSMHPLKMLVYAAAGVPIISTRIENLGDFEPFIGVARDHDAFLDCVDAAVAGPCAVDREALAAVVEKNAWSRRVDDIMALVDRSLAGQQESASNSA